jgi:hypothetical protein
MRFFYDEHGQYRGRSNGLGWELFVQFLRFCVFAIVLAWPFSLHVGAWVWAIEVPYLFILAAAYGFYRAWKDNR